MKMNRQKYLDIKQKYPNHVPVIMQPVESKQKKTLDKTKYIVPNETTVGDFMNIIRRRLKVGSSEALFFFVNNTMQTGSTLMSQVHCEHSDSNGFLYMKYGLEQTYG